MFTVLNLCLIIAALTVVFHLLILTKVIPYAMTWGGRLKTDREMYVFESVSIVVNLFFIYLLLARGDYIQSFLSPKIVHISLWVFLGLFTLNTIGNIFAKTRFEKYFTIVTLLLAVLLYLIVK